jgi:hypothetical protein
MFTPTKPHFLKIILLGVKPLGNPLSSIIIALLYGFMSPLNALIRNTYKMYGAICSCDVIIRPTSTLLKYNKLISMIDLSLLCSKAYRGGAKFHMPWGHKGSKD